MNTYGFKEFEKWNNAKKKFYRVGPSTIKASAGSESVPTSAMESPKNDPEEEIAPSGDSSEEMKEARKFYNNRSNLYAYGVTIILLLLRIVF